MLLLKRYEMDEERRVMKFLGFCFDVVKGGQSFPLEGYFDGHL